MHTLGAFLVIAAVLAVAGASYLPRCDPPDVPDYGGYSGRRKHSYHIGSVIYFYCYRGYKLHGYSWTVCLHNAEYNSAYWDYPSPVCRKVFHDDDDDDDDDDSDTSDSTTRSRAKDCGKLPNPRYGVVRLTGTSVGSKAKYSCNDGFNLVGDAFRKCRRNGKWSGDAPVCKPVDCGDLDDPDNGRVDLSGTTFGSKAVYSCDKGFFLVGDSKRVCQANGEWSGDAPICKPVDCGDLDDPDNGRVDLSGTTFGSKAVYSCDKGFFLVGDSKRVCQANGEWSGDAPICKRVVIDCGYLPNPKNGWVHVKCTRVGCKASYDCRHGFKLVGVYRRFCLSNGYWSDEAPVCSRKH